jgi:choline-sulfatase
MWAILAVSGGDIERPNILFVVGDDLAYRAVGAGGKTIVPTPNLDRLANRGVWFERAYCNSPVCTASRQSLLTGRMPTEIGVTQLQTPLGDEPKTLAEILSAAGWRTVVFGKMHFNSTRKHGFDLIVDRPDHQRWLTKKTRKPLPAGVQTLGQWKPFVDPARVWLNADALPYPAWDEDMLSTWLVSQASEFFRKPSDRPFLAFVSLTEPHSPFHFPVEDAGKANPSSWPVTTASPQDAAQIPAIFRDLAPGDKQGIAAAYATSTAFFDRNVGRLLDGLKQAGLEDRTIVVFLGDHGYMLGEHGRFEKHCFFEQAVRCPLAIVQPRRIAPRRTASLVELIDVAPTVLELVHVAAPAEMTGKSLASLLQGSKAPHRDEVVSVYAENQEAMIRDERWKLVVCAGTRDRQDGYATGRPLPGRTRRLYDLQSDPEENRDLAASPAHAERVARMEKKLLVRLEARYFRKADAPKDLRASDLLDWLLTPRDALSLHSPVTSKSGATH